MDVETLRTSKPAPPQCKKISKGRSVDRICFIT